jgi:hypothetical protein
MHTWHAPFSHVSPAAQHVPPHSTLLQVLVQTPLSHVCPDAQHVPPHSTFGQLLESCVDEPPSAPDVVWHIMSTHDCPSPQSSFVVHPSDGVGELPPPLHAVATSAPASGARTIHGKLAFIRLFTLGLPFARPIPAHSGRPTRKSRVNAKPPRDLNTTRVWRSAGPTFLVRTWRLHA